MLLTFIITILSLSLFSKAQPSPENGPYKRTEAAANREYFYVGGEYIETNNGHIFSGQMYVEKLVPKLPRQPYPLVLIHGQAQTGTNWLNKPDGNPGWATYFLNKGYTIYILDQTERGRSPWNPNGETNMTVYSAELISQRFTAPAKFNLWPQAKLHTQWQGIGVMGDPIFDNYYASTIQFQSSALAQESRMRTAGSALLQKIGPSILIAHSQGGLMPWVITDSVPFLVKAIISIEPTGPPFREAVFSSTATRPWGLTSSPLRFSPASVDSSPQAELETLEVPNETEGLKTCLLQKEPARKFLGFTEVKVLVVTSEASYHAPYDGCTVRFLRQAGVETEWLRLQDIGIHGNGHLMFMEKNSDEIAGVLNTWIHRKVI